MDKHKSRCYSSDPRSKGFNRHCSVLAKRGEGGMSTLPSGASSKPVDPRQAQHRVSFPLHSFRIPRKDGGSTRSLEEEPGRSNSRERSSRASRWDDRTFPSERREGRDRRNGDTSSSEDKGARRPPWSYHGSSGSVNRLISGCRERGEEELQERESGTKPVRPTSLACGVDKESRKRALFRQRPNLAESKRRRVGTGGSSEEEGSSHKSLRARLAEDRGKVFQLGTRQPTEVATLPGPLSGSPPRSSAQRSSVETVSSPEPPPPGVTEPLPTAVTPEAPKRKRGRPRKDSTLQGKKGKVDKVTVSKQQQVKQQQEEAQPVVTLSDYSSTDEWPIVPSPPAQSIPTVPFPLTPPTQVVPKSPQSPQEVIPMSCSDMQEEDSSSNIAPAAPLVGPSTGGEENNTTLTPNTDALKPPSTPRDAEVSQGESTVLNACHHRDFAGKRCCNPALEGKRLCKCHYGDTLKLQEALGLLVSSAVQESSESGRSTPHVGEGITLETEPVSPVEMDAPITLAKEEPPSAITAEPPHLVCVKAVPLQMSVKAEPTQQDEPEPTQQDDPEPTQQDEPEPTQQDEPEPAQPEPTQPEPTQPEPAQPEPTQQCEPSAEQTQLADEAEVIQAPEVQMEARKELARLTPTELTLQNGSEAADNVSESVGNEGESAGQMDASSCVDDPAVIVLCDDCELRVVPEKPSGEKDTAALSQHESVSELDQLNVKEQGLMARLVSLRKKKLAKEKEVAMLLQHIENMKQEIQQASAEWTQVNEAKRLLVLGDTATVQESCSSQQRQQQDGNETQDAHTTGSPVPTGITTPPAQPLQQPSSVTSAFPPTAVQALGRLFQPPHNASVLDVKLAKNVMITTSRDRTTHLYHNTSGCLLGTYEHHTKAVTCLAVSASGSTFVTGSNDCSVMLYPMEKCQQPLQFAAASKVMCLKLIGNIIVAGLDNGRVQVFEVSHPQKKTPLWTVRCYVQSRPITAIDANRNYFVVGTTEECDPIMYWRLQDFLPSKGAPLYTNNKCLTGMGGNILSLQLGGESTLFSSTSQGHILMHDLSTGHLVHCLHAASSAVPCVQATNCGHLFVSTMNSTIKCFNLKDYSMKGVLQMPHPVYRFTVLQNYLYYGDDQGTVGVICTDSVTQ